MMTYKEFENNLDLYSADLSRWPVELMKVALELTAQDEKAQALFEDTIALDDVLRGYEPPPRDLSNLEAQILSAVQSAPQGVAEVVVAPAAMSWRPAYLFAPGGGFLIAALMLGFSFGMNPAPTQASTLLDPVFYAQDQIIDEDNDMIIEEGLL